jgi:thioredoxin 1
MIMSLLHLTRENFEQAISDNEVLIVDFWAPWCGPCRMLTPVLEQVSNAGVCKVGKVNVDEEDDLAAIFRVSSIPTVLLYKNGKMVDKKVGYMDYDKIVNWVKSHE